MKKKFSSLSQILTKRKISATINLVENFIGGYFETTSRTEIIQMRSSKLKALQGSKNYFNKKFVKNFHGNVFFPQFEHLKVF